jgi:hypothetical protein
VFGNGKDTGHNNNDDNKINSNIAAKKEDDGSLLLGYLSMMNEQLSRSSA